MPALATSDLAGRTVTEVLARGKHILARIDDDLTFHSHLKMDGSWYLSRAGGRAPRRHPDHLIRARLGNAEWLATGYRVHDLRIVRRSDEDQLVGHLGPDLLGPDWDVGRAVANLAAEPDAPIGEALLDQRKLAGIGNLYKSEVLFIEHVHPWTPTGDVADLARLVTAAQRLLRAEPRPPRAVDDRPAGPRARPLGLRARRSAVPALPDTDPAGRTGHAAAGAQHLLVPELPARPSRAEVQASSFWICFVVSTARCPDAGRFSMAAFSAAGATADGPDSAAIEARISASRAEPCRSTVARSSSSTRAPVESCASSAWPSAVA